MRSGLHPLPGPMLAAACDHPAVRAVLCAGFAALLLAAPAGAAPAQTLTWAQARANHVHADLMDYYGLTLRFAAVPGSASCAGVGPSVATNGAKGWSLFECHARLRGQQGNMFPGVAGVIFVLTAAGKVERLRVTSCTGKACPVHSARSG